MINFKLLSSALFCIFLSSSLGSPSSAQQLFNFQQPVFNGRIIQQRPIQTQQYQRAQYQAQQNQRPQYQVPQYRVRTVQRQVVAQPRYSDQQFFHPTQTTQSQSARRRIVSAPTPAAASKPVAAEQESPAPIGLARAKIAELNEEIDELKEKNSELETAAQENKELKTAQSKIAELNKSIKELEEQNSKLKIAAEKYEDLQSSQLRIAELNESTEDLKEQDFDRLSEDDENE